jgi:hypothetical protein
MARPSATAFSSGSSESRNNRSTNVPLLHSMRSCTPAPEQHQILSYPAPLLLAPQGDIFQGDVIVEGRRRRVLGCHLHLERLGVCSRCTVNRRGQTTHMERLRSRSGTGQGHTQCNEHGFAASCSTGNTAEQPTLASSSAANTGVQPAVFCMLLHFKIGCRAHLAAGPRAAAG